MLFTGYDPTCKRVGAAGYLIFDIIRRNCRQVVCDDGWRPRSDNPVSAMSKGVGHYFLAWGKLESL